MCLEIPSRLLYMYRDVCDVCDVREKETAISAVWLSIDRFTYNSLSAIQLIDRSVICYSITV